MENEEEAGGRKEVKVIVSRSGRREVLMAGGLEADWRTREGPEQAEVDLCLKGMESGRLGVSSLLQHYRK